MSTPTDTTIEDFDRYADPERFDDEPLTCDNCERECNAAYGSPDIAVMCCHCRAKSAREFGPRNYPIRLCDLCRAS